MVALNELAKLEALENKLRQKQRANSNKYRYRYQALAVKDLGISTPPRLKGLNVALGWGSAAVEVLMQRLFWRGYWSPESGGEATAEFLNGLYRENFLLLLFLVVDMPVVYAPRSSDHDGRNTSMPRMSASHNNTLHDSASDRLLHPQ